MYKGFNFNSMCVDKGGRLLAAGDGGIYEIGGDTDDGDLIAAFFELPTKDFGTSKNKKLREVLVSGETDGEFVIESGDGDATGFTSVSVTGSGVIGQIVSSELSAGDRKSVV